MFGAARFQTPEILATIRVQREKLAYLPQVFHAQNRQEGNEKPCHEFRLIDVFKSAAYKSHRNVYQIRNVQIANCVPVTFFNLIQGENMKKIAIVALLSALVATPALADNTGKIYIAGDLGAATYSNVSPFPNPGVIRFAFGSHFNPNFAAEVGYSKFGDSTLTGPGGSATLSASAFQIAAIGSFPLNPQFDLTGKLGITHNSAKGSSTFGVSVTTSNNSVLFGAGAQYHFNSQVSLRAQYENYGDFESGPSPLKASAVSLGVVYNF